MTSGGNNFNDIPDHPLTKFRVFIGWSRIFIPPLNFYEASRFVHPYKNIAFKTKLRNTNQYTMEQSVKASKRARSSSRTHSGRTGAIALCVKLHLRLKTHGVENRRRFSESKIGTDFRNVCHAKTTPIFDSENRRRFTTPNRTCSISRSIFRSTWSIETVVIGWSSLFSFGLFVNSAELVNKHFDYIFYYFCYAL